MAKRLAPPLTRAKLLRDLDAERNLKADAMRQRNDALGSLAQANQKVAALEAKLASAQVARANVISQSGYLLETVGMMMQQVTKG